VALLYWNRGLSSEIVGGNGAFGAILGHISGKTKVAS